MWTRGERRRRPAAERADVLLAVAAGGAIGSLARYGLTVVLPYSPGQFASATLLANVSGCLLIGVLMAVITESTAPHRLLRPFLGIGVLGGFTTFSTYVADTIGSASAGAYPVAVMYGMGTVVTCLLAVLLGLFVARALLRAKGSRGGTA